MVDWVPKRQYNTYIQTNIGAKTMAIPVKQFLEEYRVIVEETAVEVFGSVEEFIKAYNAEVDARPKRRYNTNINSKQGANHV